MLTYLQGTPQINACI